MTDDGVATPREGRGGHDAYEPKDSPAAGGARGAKTTGWLPALATWCRAPDSAGLPPSPPAPPCAGRAGSRPRDRRRSVAKSRRGEAASHVGTPHRRTGTGFRSRGRSHLRVHHIAHVVCIGHVGPRLAQHHRPAIGSVNAPAVPCAQARGLPKFPGPPSAGAQRVRPPLRR